MKTFLVVAAAAGLAIGCDDDDDNITGGTGTGGTGGTSTCTQQVVAEEQMSLDQNAMTVIPFTTSTAGRVDVTVQWTTQGAQLGAFIAQTGSCNESQFTGGTCTFAGRSAGSGGTTDSASAFTGSSPGRFAAQNVAAGNWDLILMNYGTSTGNGGTGGTGGGTSQDPEAVAVQVVSSTGSSCPAFPPASS
jgi:hypothetical protein